MGVTDELQALVVMSLKVHLEDDHNIESSKYRKTKKKQLKIQRKI